MNRARMLLIPLLAVLVSTGAPTAHADPLDEIRELLGRRAAAMLGGDREAFLRTVDPGDPGFLRRQTLLFEGFQLLGLDSYRLDPAGRIWHELTTDRERARYGEEAKVLHVEERYAIRGFDRSPALEDLYLTFVPGDEGWRVASDTDLDDLALFSGRKLWELGAIRTRASEHFLFVSHPDLTSAGATVLRAAERALRRVIRRWPLPWPSRVIILAPSTSGELRRLIQASFDLDVFVAFASSGIDREEDWKLAGHRIMLNWPRFSDYPDDTSEDILTHELLHIATRDESGPMIPIFVEEGVAEWVTDDASNSILAGQVGDGSFDRRLPLDHEFVAGSDANIVEAYQESSDAMSFAASRFGGEAVAEFYDRLGEVRRAPGTWRYHIDRTMRDTFGVGYDGFEEQWARSVVRAFS